MTYNPHTIYRAEGLNQADFEHYTPSVLATTTWEGASEKYGRVSSITLLHRLFDTGMVPVWASQSASRVPGKEGLTKHMVRLRPRQYLQNQMPDMPEVIFVNSYDLSCAYLFYVGVFRKVCGNGQIVGDIADRFRVRHLGDIFEEVLAASIAAAGRAEHTMTVVEQMKQVELEPEEQLLLAQYAAKARYGEENVVEGSIVPYDKAIHPQALLHTRRNVDRGTDYKAKRDLWTTLNVVQENVIQGGVKAKGIKRARAVGAIDGQVKVNTLLWSFAEELRALHMGETKELPRQTTDELILASLND